MDDFNPFINPPDMFLTPPRARAHFDMEGGYGYIDPNRPNLPAPETPPVPQPRPANNEPPAQEVVDQYLADVLLVIPDVQPEYAGDLIRK